MTVNTNAVKAIYISNQILNSINPHIKGVGFHFPLIGLHELTRQYFSLPNEIKFLAGPQIIETIKEHIKKTKVITSVKEEIIIDRGVKKYSVNLSFVKEIGSEHAIQRLHNILHDVDFFKGIIRSIKRVLKIDHYKLEMCYRLFDELLVLLIEYLYSRGHSKEALYTKVSNILSQNKSKHFEATNKILDHLMSIGSEEFKKLEKVDIELTIKKTKHISNYKFFHSFLEDQLLDMYRSNRITDYSKNDHFSNIDYFFSIYKIDKEYINNTITKIVEKCDLLTKRLDMRGINFKIYLKGKEFQPYMSSTDEKMRIKYFDQFLMNAQFSNLSDITKLEILKILEWTNYPSKTIDKKYAFMSLWSIMEFLLIDSADDNKIDTINKNFVPYMSLFHFRKSIKLFFKDIIYQMDKEPKIASKEVEQFLDNKLNLANLDISKFTIVDKFTIFLFSKHDKLKKVEDKWLGFTNRNVSQEYLISKTLTLTHEINKKLEHFESMIRNDIKQIYRLRNMLTHSGENDGKILDNTFYRLKYYVQTLLNAISYSWMYNKRIHTLSELHELKRFDSLQYKEYLKTLNKTKDDEKWINLCDFKEAIVSYPKSSFSFIE